MKRAASKKKRWEDHYSRRAKKERLPARSVYKLQEIQKKHGLIKKGAKVLDLGCFPGSWLLFAAKTTGKRGRIIGVDLKPVTRQVPAHVATVSGDVLSMDEGLLAAIGKNFDVVLSDMAPATTGIKHVDNARSFDLCRAALSIALDVLKPGGSFVCKIFQGEDFKAFSDDVKTHFKTRKIFKPDSSRKASREIYIVGLGKKKTH